MVHIEIEDRTKQILFYLQFIFIYCLSYVLFADEFTTPLIFNWILLLSVAELCCLTMTIMYSFETGITGAMIVFSFPLVLFFLLIILITNYYSPNWWPTMKVLAISSILILDIIWCKIK